MVHLAGWEAPAAIEQSRGAEEMRTVEVIGIGAGDPEYVTVQAIKALNRADVFFFLDKGADRDDLVGVRRLICERYVAHHRYRIVEAVDPPRSVEGHRYLEALDAWRHERIILYEQLIAENLADGQVGAFLVWGDPALYDSTLRILDVVRARGQEFEVEVVAGISAVQALTARHHISLNQPGGAVQVTTGRRLVEHGWPAGVDDVVVMLDPACSFRHLVGHPLTIYWGAYLGTRDEILISGPLVERAEEIRRIRTSARSRHGWLFDTYLLRRRRDGECAEPGGRGGVPWSVAPDH